MTVLKILCGMAVIAGTYILSRQMFDDTLKRLIRFKFYELPLYLQLTIYFFGDKRKFDSRQMWNLDSYPSPQHFPVNIKLQVIGPFIGFILICFGTLSAIFL